MKLKEFGFQIVFGLIMLSLFEYFGFKTVTTVIGYIFIFILLVLVMKLFYSVYNFLQYSKESRFKANVIRKEYKWHEKSMGFIVGYFMWLMLKSK